MAHPAHSALPALYCMVSIYTSAISQTASEFSSTVFSLIITRPSYFFRVSVIGVFIGDVSVIETVFHIVSTL